MSLSLRLRGNTTLPVIRPSLIPSCDVDKGHGCVHNGHATPNEAANASWSEQPACWGHPRIAKVGVDHAGKNEETEPTYRHPEIRRCTCELPSQLRVPMLERKQTRQRECCGAPIAPTTSTITPRSSTKSAVVAEITVTVVAMAAARTQEGGECFHRGTSCSTESRAAKVAVG